MRTSWISRKEEILEKWGGGGVGGGGDLKRGHPLNLAPPPNIIFCSGSPNYFGLKFLGPPLKLGGGCYHGDSNIVEITGRRT